jgi:hypothetical protein
MTGDACDEIADIGRAGIRGALNRAGLRCVDRECAAAVDAPLGTVEVLVRLQSYVTMVALAGAATAAKDSAEARASAGREIFIGEYL